MVKTKTKKTSIKTLLKTNLGSMSKDILITSPEKEASKEKSKVQMKRGDWVRCTRGPLRGAEGSIDQLQKQSEFITILEVRQLNGNVIRLPRSHWEFAAFRPEVQAE